MGTESEQILAAVKNGDVDKVEELLSQEDYQVPEVEGIRKKAEAKKMVAQNLVQTIMDLMESLNALTKPEIFGFCKYEENEKPLPIVNYKSSQTQNGILFEGPGKYAGNYVENCEILFGEDTKITGTGSASRRELENNLLKFFTTSELLDIRRRIAEYRNNF